MLLPKMFADDVNMQHCWLHLSAFHHAAIITFFHHCLWQAQHN